MVSASTQSANEPAKDLILVYIVQLKPMIKELKHISQEELYGISDITFASVYSEKTRLKKLMMRIMIIIIIINCKK